MQSATHFALVKLWSSPPLMAQGKQQTPKVNKNKYRNKHRKSHRIQGDIQKPKKDNHQNTTTSPRFSYWRLRHTATNTKNVHVLKTKINESASAREKGSVATK